MRGLFDQLALALRDKNVRIDAGLDKAAEYKWLTDTLLLRPDASTYDVVHELVHAVDDMNSWYVNTNENSFSTEKAEQIAYTTEFILARLANTDVPPNPNTLDKFNQIAFATVAAAQAQWSAGWGQLDRVINSTVYYEVLSVDNSRGATTADVQDVGAKLGLVVSQAELLPIYNSFLERQGFPVGSLIPVLNNAAFA